MTARLRSVRSAFHMERSGLIRVVIAGLVLPLATLACVPTASANEPLRDLINRELAPHTGKSWPKASDAEFLRRVTLDLNGMPPTADEARAFLADTDPAKREKLVDQLLASPLYARHLSTTLDVMLMERRRNTNVSQEVWQAWLLESVRSNKPWNVLAREIMTADGDDPAQRAAARFYLDRDSEPNVITRDLGRIFFGRDMQCNQCHDSPLVADYMQRDYHGLLAIASTGYAVKKKIDDKTEISVYAERSGSDLTFESVFDKGNAHRTAARIPGGTTIVEPAFLPGDEYTVAPADGVRSVPKFSRRAALAEQATNGSNRVFNENIANRMWAFMLGRGLVHPLDMMHPDNPASSPILMTQLGERFAAMNFDMKAFLREIALSDVYQRPFDMTPEITDALADARAEQQRLATIAEALDVHARDAASIHSDADTAYSTAEVAMIPVATEVDTARAQYADARKKLNEAQKALDAATAAHSLRKTVTDTLQQSLTALQTATTALPNDAELAATAKTLSDRVQKLAAELPALEKAVTDTTATVTPATATLTTTQGTLDAAQQKLQPLLDAVLAEEAKVVAARAAMQEARLTAVSTRDRLTALERIAAAGDQKKAVSAATQAVASNESAMTTATQQITEYMPVVVQRTAAMTDAQQLLTTATTAVTSAQEQVSSYRTAMVTLNEAAAALKNAQAALPADETMTAAMTTLTAKATATQASLATAEQTLVTASQMSATATEKMKAAQAAMSEANTELQRRQELASKATAAAAQSREALTTASAAWETSLATVPTDLSTRFALSQLKPLTPEQMCWTVFRVTQVYDRYAVTELAELEKAAPATEEQKKDPAFMAARAIQLEQRVFDKLKGNIASYVQMYGGGPGQPQNDFFASADQALFTSNGGAINSWIVPAGENPTNRVIKATDARVAAEELFLGVLTRMPTEDEVTDVTNFLAARPDRARAAQELVWGLLSSAEFRFNR